jgi:site-specific DNA recombinase
MSNPSSTAIYVRISRDREGEQVGIDRQEADCRALATHLGLDVAHVYADNDISASTLSKKRRPQYEQMMRLAETGKISTILAYSNSRLTRRPLELERLITAHDRTGLQFRTVVSGQDDLSKADGRMVARIKASVDAAESERIGERVRRAQAEAREQGQWHGGWRPFGFADDGLTPFADEGAEIARAARNLLHGRSMVWIMNDLNKRGVTTSTGKPWSTRTLARVLRRPHPALADGVYEAVQAILDDPTRRTTPGSRPRWMLSGIALCGLCDTPLRGSASSKGVGQGTYPAYRCMVGKHLVVSATTLDAYIEALVVERMRRPDAADLFEVRHLTHVDPHALRLEAEALRQRRNNLADDLSIDESVLVRRARRLTERIEEIEQAIASSVSSSPLAEFATRDPQEVWDGMDVERRKMVIGRLMGVTVNRGRRGVVALEHRWRTDMPAFDPRRVHVVWK